MFKVDDGRSQGWGISTDDMVIVILLPSRVNRTEHLECDQSENQLKQNIIKGQKYLQCKILCSIFNILLLPKQNKINKPTNHLDNLVRQIAIPLSCHHFTLPTTLHLWIYSNKMSSSAFIFYLRQDQEPLHMSIVMIGHNSGRALDFVMKCRK